MAIRGLAKRRQQQRQQGNEIDAFTCVFLRNHLRLCKPAKPKARVGIEGITP